MRQDVFEYIVYRLSGKEISDYYKKVPIYQLKKILRDYYKNKKITEIKNWNEILQYFQRVGENPKQFENQHDFYKWLYAEQE